jgi:hypothetical protein
MRFVPRMTCRMRKSDYWHLVLKLPTALWRRATALQAGDPVNWRIEIIKGFFLNCRRDFSRYTV